MLRKLSVPLFVAFVISGCNCNDEPAPEQSVTITAPKSGATLTMKDDTANNVDGLQIAVTATISGFGADAKATLSVNGTAGTPIDALTTSLTFPGVTLQEGPNVLKVEVTDANGSKDAVVSLTADLTVVSCTVELIEPEKDKVLKKSDSLAGTGMQLKAKVKTSGCVGGIVRVCAQADGATGTNCEKAGGKVVGELPLSTTNLTEVLVTLPEGEMALAAEHKANDGALNASAAHSVTVDTQVPTCEFVAPAENAVLTTQNVDVQVRCTGVEVDQLVSVSSNLLTDAATGKMTAEGLVSIPMVLPAGEQTLTAKATDKAGNQSAPVTRAITVSIEGCDIILSAPVGGSLNLNLANGNVTGTPPKGSFAFKGSSTRCPDGTLKILRTRNGTETEVASVVMTNGTFSKAVDFDDGECGGKIALKVEKAGWQANAGVSVSYSTDFTPPSLDDIDPPLGNLFVVNDSNPNKGQPGYVVDADPVAGGGQVAVELDVTGAGDVCGARVGNIRIVAGTKELLNESSADNALQVLTRTITLDEGLSGPVNIVLKDAADNVVTAKWDAKVSTLPLPVLKVTYPTAGILNLFKDVGGDRSSYAQIPATVTMAGAIPTGSELVLCTSLVGAAGASCRTTGFTEIPGTKLLATGSPQTYTGVRLPQGTQDLIAEMRNELLGATSSPALALQVDTKPPRVTNLACSEDTNSDGVLSGNELPVGQPAHLVVTVADVEDGQTATLLEGTTSLAAQSVTSGSATFTVPSLSDGSHVLRVAISDKSGNPNESTTLSPQLTNPTAYLTLAVHRVAPSIARIAPTSSLCNKAADLNPATTACDLDFIVLVGSSTVRVDYSLNPSAAGSMTPASVTSFANGQATSRFSLAQSTAAIEIVATAYDAHGNSRQASYTISHVDTIPPSIAFVSPTNNQVMFSQTFPVVVQTDAEPGQTVSIRSLTTNGVVGEGPVIAGSPSNTATFNVSVTGASQDLSATVSDIAGNPSSPAVVGIQLNLSGCDINFTAPTSASPVFNLANAPGGTVEIRGYSSLAGCGNKQVDFTAAVDGGPAQPAGSTTTDSSGNFAFQFTFADGSLTTFSAKSVVSGSSANGFTALTDVTPPTLLVSSPALANGQQLHLVAKSGNLNVKANTPGYIAEADETIQDGQLPITLEATGAGASANQGKGNVAVFQGTVEAFKQEFVSNATQNLSPTVTLAQGFIGLVRIVASDQAGNSASLEWNATVDVVAPPSPTLVTTDPGTGVFTKILDERRADIDAVFATEADSGPPGPSTFELRYTTERALGSLAFDDVAFDNAAVFSSISPAPTGALGNPLTAQLRSIAPLNTYFPVLRAVDASGNRSIMPTKSPIAVMWRSVVLPFPGTTSTPANFGSQISAGDIDADERPDFAAAAPACSTASFTNAGAFVVYSTATTPPTPKQTIYGDATNQGLGSALLLADLNKDKRAEILAVGSGKVRVYFATTSVSDPYPSVPDLIISGPSSLSAIASIPDYTGDGAVEIAIGSRAANSNKGAVYIFRSKPSWPTGTLDVSAADTIINGVETNAFLTFGGGMTGLARLDSDNLGDLAVPAPGAKKLFLYKGASLASLSGTSDTNSGNVALTFTGTNSWPYSSVVADFDGDSILDVGGGEILGAALHVYKGTAAGTFTTPDPATPWSTGTANYGRPALAGDLTGDLRPDLLVGASPTTTSGQVYFYFSRSSPGLSATPGAILSGGTAFGKTVTLSDINNDTKLDVLIGDSAGNGNVHITY